MDQTRPVPNRRASRATRRTILLSGMVLVLGLLWIGSAAASGYSVGQNQARKLRKAEEQLALQEQFDLGVEDLLATRYELARQRFEYLLSVDPNYPGAAELLDRALAALSIPTATITPSPIPATPTPTLDLSSLEGLWSQAQLLFSQDDWDGALVAMLALRSEDRAFHVAEVNELMAAALRNRGIEKIKRGEREQGLYDLALAERFGPLDSQAVAWRNSAIFYLQANSYYGLDPALASQYWSQLCAGGGWDACYKYARSARDYGDLLYKQAQFCPAATQYAASIITNYDAALAPTAEQAEAACMTATAGTPTLTSTPTWETPTLEFTVFPTVETATLTPTLPEATPTETPTLPPTPAPTETPSPTTGPT